MRFTIIECPDRGRMTIKQDRDGRLTVRTGLNLGAFEPMPTCSFGRPDSENGHCRISDSLMPVIVYFSGAPSTAMAKMTHVRKGQRLVACWPITHVAYATTLRVLLLSDCCYFRQFAGLKEYLPVDIEMKKIFHFVFSSGLIMNAFKNERCDLKKTRQTVMDASSDVKSIFRHIYSCSSRHFDKDGMLNGLNLLFSMSALLELDYDAMESELRTLLLSDAAGAC